MAKLSAFARLKQADESVENAPQVAERRSVEVSAQPRPIQASRVGRKTVIFYDRPEAVRALKQLGLDHDRTLQDLMHEALDDLLVKYGKHAFGKR